MARPLTHLTILTGDQRESPRREVERHVVRAIQDALDASGSGALWDSGWAVLSLPAPPGGRVYDLSHQGVEVARCWLAIERRAADTLWADAARSPTLSGAPPAMPEAIPWLAVGLLPEGMEALAARPALMMELGDLERCVAWTLMPDRGP